jgi:hypothetical protein
MVFGLDVAVLPFAASSTNGNFGTITPCQNRCVKDDRCRRGQKSLSVGHISLLTFYCQQAGELDGGSGQRQLVAFKVECGQRQLILPRVS